MPTPLSAAACLVWFALVGIAQAQAMECEDTHEGRVCRLPQAITAGTAVNIPGSTNVIKVDIA